jgi:hypothetical protein
MNSIFATQTVVEGAPGSITCPEGTVDIECKPIHDHANERRH